MSPSFTGRAVKAELEHSEGRRRSAETKSEGWKVEVDRGLMIKPR
jgi:hypothetical protein